MKMTFGEAQIDINKKMQQLHNITQQLLLDLISNMNVDESDKIINGYEIDDYKIIESILDSNTLLITEDGFDDEDNYKLVISSLTQAQQKDLIDHILLKCPHLVDEKLASDTNPSHKVIDLVYTEEEGNECFFGTEKECYDFISQQGESAFSFKVILNL